jgi:uncharacterized protein (TIGR02145 family)
MKILKLKKLGILSTICLFSITLFLNGLISANASVSQSVLGIAKGGTNANSVESAQINLGRTDSISFNSTDDQLPSAKAVYNYIQRIYGNLSTDNTNFSSAVTNWTGGNLIYKNSRLSTTAADNKIKIDGVDCTTSGQGYTTNSAAGDGIPQVGCVLPSLAEGPHEVKISVDGGVNYSIYAGAVNYKQTPVLSGCDTTSMQTFGADADVCKASMQQGQVIVLNDTRDNQKYRVKKMPDGNVWMIDNWKYTGSPYTDPKSTAYCSSTGLVWTHNPGSFTGCGYLYNWDATLTVSPSGWSLYSTTGETKSTYKLNNKTLAVAADSDSNRNPVYSTTDYKNFGEGGTGFPSPWLGVYSGGSFNDNFSSQGSDGYYWSSTEYDSTLAHCLHFISTHLNTNGGSSKSYSFPVRSVL